MKEILVPIDQAGRVVLPKQVREELAIQPGDLLKLSVQGAQVTLALNESKAGFQRRGKALVFTTAGEETFGHDVVDSLLNDLRGERLALPAGSSAARKRKG